MKIHFVDNLVQFGSETGRFVNSDDDLSDSFVNNISDTDSELGLGFDDDTDIDPDYEATVSSSDESDGMSTTAGRTRPVIPSYSSNIDTIIDQVVRNPPHLLSDDENDDGDRPMDDVDDHTPNWTPVDENNDNFAH